jgi:ABC-type bacteriocin/lantibiotic exporter with double-glycine peptidase domain
MPVSWLKIPHFQQTTEGTCLQTCVRMILAYLQRPVEEGEVTGLFEADDSGVTASRVLRLEQWGFQVTYGSTTLEELQAWLAQGLPPIVLVHTQFLDYWTTNTAHAVVVVGIEGNSVYLNDPAFDTVPQLASIGWLSGSLD